MSVPRFHLEGPLRAGSTVRLAEEAAHHAVHVLRIRTGDEVTVFDGRGGEYAARVASVQKLNVAVDLLEHRAIEREAPLRMVLIQGVSSGERMDFTIRKAVELGVAEIRPLVAAASVARPKGERAAARQQHWQKIAIAACEQCGRNRIPPVHPLSGRAPVEEPAGLKVLLSPQAKLRFSEITKRVETDVIIAAGPEAGFNAAEQTAFLDAGFVPASLGPRVLRTETAALAALAALNALRGDF